MSSLVTGLEEKCHFGGSNGKEPERVARGPATLPRVWSPSVLDFRVPEFYFH